MKLSIFATFLAVSLVSVYFIFAYFFQLFFDGRLGKAKFSIFHIAFFLGFYIFCLYVMQFFDDPVLANRFQHAIAGGFAVMLVIFFSYRASLVNITKFQFFAISCLLATAAGVGVEMAEYVAQNYLDLMLAPDANDIWLDLYANTFGILLGAMIFTPFVKK